MTISDAKAASAKHMFQAGYGEHHVRKELKIGKGIVSAIVSGTWNASKRVKLEKTAAIAAQKKLRARVNVGQEEDE